MRHPTEEELLRQVVSSLRLEGFDITVEELRQLAQAEEKSKKGSLQDSSKSEKGAADRD